jgi:hypothetical protein
VFTVWQAVMKQMDRSMGDLAEGYEILFKSSAHFFSWSYIHSLQTMHLQQAFIFILVSWINAYHCCVMQGLIGLTVQNLSATFI